MATEHAIAGCLAGTAIGDALGLPSEGLNPQRARRLFPDVDRFYFLFGRGMFSDDTEHACMTAQSLLVCGHDPRRFLYSIAWRLRWWFVGLPPSVGLATLKACVKLWLGVSPRRSGVWSAGNGPCMRAPIIGVVLRDHEPLMREFVRLSTRLTHTDPRAEQAALLIATAAGIASEAREGPLDRTAVFTRLNNVLGADAREFQSALRQVQTSLEQGEPTETFATNYGGTRGVSGYVLHTVPVVLHAWLRFTDDYPSAVRTMVRCGGDTDTTAAIVGALVGTRVGLEGIPERWRTRLAEWPRDLRWMNKLSRELARGIAEPRNAVRLNPLGLVGRNLLFIVAVFAHVFRRAFPPY